MANDPSSWADDWMALQKKYWNALGGLPSRNTTENKSPPSPADVATNAWSDAIDSWWKIAAPQAAPPVQDFFSQLIEQGKSYFQMSEQLSRMLQSSAAAGQSASQWQTAITEALNSMKEGFLSSTQYNRDAMSKWMGVWELPVDHWQHIASSLSMMPGDFLKGLNTADLRQVTEPVQERLDQFLSVPGVGHMRERQAVYQELIRLGIKYQEALREYMQACNQIGIKSIEKLQNCFGNQSQEELKIDSLRSLYDLWVDCCEEAYAEYVESDEYVRIHGNLVNTLMALKQHNAMIVDDSLEAMNIPNRQEVNALQQRFHQLWRDNKAMQREIETLKEQLKAKKPATARSRKNATTRSARTSRSADK
jgi:poly[(R)-3-hydroxyalkanoate] polymerase subunit PhaE